MSIEPLAREIAEQFRSCPKGVYLMLVEILRATGGQAAIDAIALTDAAELPSPKIRISWDEYRIWLTLEELLQSETGDRRD